MLCCVVLCCVVLCCVVLCCVVLCCVLFCFESAFISMPPWMIQCTFSSYSYTPCQILTPCVYKTKWEGEESGYWEASQKLLWFVNLLRGLPSIPVLFLESLTLLVSIGGNMQLRFSISFRQGTYKRQCLWGAVCGRCEWYWLFCLWICHPLSSPFYFKGNKDVNW